MHRTTIMLPSELHRSAEAEARQLGISLSELIRRRLAPRPTRAGKPRPAFFDRAPWTGSCPADLAARHDEYLYGK